MKESFEELVEMMEKCFERCPWIKKQTLEKQKEEILSEARELAKAIEKKDYANLKEELGDLLWDTLMISLMAEKQGLFRTKEVIEAVKEKMRRRKPYVFGDMKIETAEEAVALWNEIKKKEKNEHN